MWARMQEAAVLLSLPDPLEKGRVIRGVRIGRRVKGVPGNRQYKGLKEYCRYLVRQFYDVEPQTFLKWQNGARYTALPENPGFGWASDEWSGGLILPDYRGDSLDTLLSSQPRLSVPETLELGYTLAYLLRVQHEAGIAHLNLDPQSIVIEKGHSVRALRHFGVARRKGWHDSWESGCAMVRDMRFAAPEVLKGQRGSEASDVYSFAAILVHSMMGRTPVTGVGRLICGMPRVWDSLLQFFRFPPEFPEPLAKLLLFCFRHNPQARPTMAELVPVLEQWTTVAAPDVDPIPEVECSECRLDRIMIFIQPDQWAEYLFDEAIRRHEAGSVAVLFVSAAPANLATGESEKFKVRALKVLAAGLKRCREAGVTWGLRYFDEVDQNRTALHLAASYSPDEILLGQPGRRNGLKKMQSNLSETLLQAGFPVRHLDSSD